MSCGADATVVCLDVEERRHVRLSVIVPAFEEELRLASTVRDLRAELDASFGEDYEIIVVDDGSRDGTFEAAMYVADHCARCRVISYGRNAGKGYAMQRGFESARGRLVAFFDADGEIAGAAVAALARRLQPGVSAVVGRRRWTRPRPWHRRLASASLARFAHAAFDVTVPETQAGVKVMVRADVEGVVRACRERGYLFDLELLARMCREGLRLRSVDVAQDPTRPWRIGLLACARELLPAFRIWADLQRAQPRSTWTGTKGTPIAARAVREERMP